MIVLLPTYVAQWAVQLGSFTRYDVKLIGGLRNTSIDTTTTNDGQWACEFGLLGFGLILWTRNLE